MYQTAVQVRIRWPDGRVESRDLGTAPLLVGRDAECQVQLADLTVSRRHALLAAQDGKCLVTDLGSANGTFVNGNRIASHASILIRPGDEVGIGAVRIMLEAPSAAPGQMPVQRAQGSVTPAAPAMPYQTPDGSLTSPEKAFATPAAPVTPSSSEPGATSFAMEQGAGLTYVGIGYRPPRLVVWNKGRAREYVLGGSAITIGRDATCSVVLDDPQVSRHHAEVRRGPSGYEIADTGSTNGVFYNGQRITQHPMLDNDVFIIGDNVQVVFRSGAAEPPPPGPATLQIDIGTRDALTIGRDPKNDIPLNHPQISRFHARLDRKGATLTITDLNSTNGTYVNGTHVGQKVLTDTDHIQIGPYEFTIAGGQVAAVSLEGNIRVDAFDLSRVVSKNRVIMHNISLCIKPREFIAIVGVSGSGKSTLMNALAGFKPATTGRVQYNGNDLYSSFEAYRKSIGYVPQDDIIHRELSVYHTLDYAARLRLPRDTTWEERNARIGEVLKELNLEEQRDTAVGQLSGGQRKRVSIGVELLTRPSLFFLDEPTSGLDPATETRMMQLQRQLADQGRTIILITHATQNILLCDKVAFLSRGGYLAFFGAPNQALDFFGAEDFTSIYEILNAEKTPGTIAAKYLESTYHQEHLGDLGRIAPPSAAAHAATSAGSAQKGISSLQQFLILSWRTIDVTLANRKALAIVMLQAPIIAVLIAVMYPRAIFSDRPFYVDAAKVVEAGLTPNPLEPIPNCGVTQEDINKLPPALRDSSMTEPCGDASRAMSLLFMFAIITVWFGASNASKEIVKELPIYRRERLVGIRVLPYLLSKLTPLLIIAAIQVGILNGVAMLVVKFPVYSISTPIGLVAVTYANAVAATMMGLFISALVGSVDESESIVPIMLIPQAMFAGALLSLRKMTEATQFIANFVITRWSWEAMGGILDLPRIAEEQGGFSYRMLVEQKWLEAFDVDLRVHLTVLISFSVVFLLGAYIALRRKDVV